MHSLMQQAAGTEKYSPRISSARHISRPTADHITLPTYG